MTDLQLGSWLIFLIISSLLKVSSCLIVLLADRIWSVLPSPDKFTGAHFPASLVPTIFCQLADMMLSLLSSSPIFQSSHSFSTMCSICRGKGVLRCACEIGRFIKLETRSNSRGGYFLPVFFRFGFNGLSFSELDYIAMKENRFVHQVIIYSSLSWSLSHELKVLFVSHPTHQGVLKMFDSRLNSLCTRIYLREIVPSVY